MSRLTPEHLEEIRARLAAATPGPWDYWFEVETRVGPSRENPIALVKQMRHARCPGGVRGTGVDADAALIAAAPTDLRDLLAEVQRLQAEIQPRIERSIAFQEAMEEAEAERDRMEIQVERLKQTLRLEVIRLEGEIAQIFRERDDARKWARRWKAAARRSRLWTNRFARMALRLARRPGKTDADPK